MKGREDEREVKEWRSLKRPDGRELRELARRWMEEGEMKGDIEDEVMEEERGTRGRES